MTMSNSIGSQKGPWSALPHVMSKQDMQLHKVSHSMYLYICLLKRKVSDTGLVLLGWHYFCELTLSEMVQPTMMCSLWTP